MMLAHHGALDKLKLFHLEDGGFNHQRDYKAIEIAKNMLSKNYSISDISSITGLSHDEIKQLQP